MLCAWNSTAPGTSIDMLAMLSVKLPGTLNAEKNVDGSVRACTAFSRSTSTTKVPTTPVRFALAGPRLSVALLKETAMVRDRIPLFIDVSARPIFAPVIEKTPPSEKVSFVEPAFASACVRVNVAEPDAPCVEPTDHEPCAHETLTWPAGSAVVPSA